MNNMVSFQVIYDRDSDVLYLSSRQEAATKGKRDSYGIVWRYDSDGKLIGATVMDFRDYWEAHLSVLERQISERFDVPVAQVRVILEHAKQQ